LTRLDRTLSTGDGLLMQSEISPRFQALASRPESQLGLAEGALVLAAEVRPELDIDSSLTALDELVERARPLIEAADTKSAAVAKLNHVLFELENFRGDKEQYDDPRNSFLDEVLSRRRGLPITLSILYVEVARRLGLEAYGVGFPGHFLAKVSGLTDAPAGEIIIDPFFARILPKEECVQRLQALTHVAGTNPDALFAPATALEIYTRVLNNLKVLYLRNGDGLSALGCFDRILVLAPSAALEYRDRAFLLERLECLHAAIEDYSQYLELAPNHEDVAAIRVRRDVLVRQKPRLN
jgi:regulator of sirC expression with transglutaminase-like and TPR domain